EVAMLGKFGGATHRVFGHRLAERDGGSLDRFVAGRAIRRVAASFEAPLDPAKIVIPAATDATRIRSVAVELYDMLGGEPRHLMQIVDILGDDGRNLAGPVQRSQRAMTASRPRLRKHRLHGETPPPRLCPGIRTGHEFVERDRAVTGPQSTW